MTKNLGLVLAALLGMLPGAAQAQSNQTARANTQAAATPTGNESEVVWLRRRIERLEAQLASGGGACSPEAKTKMKRKKDSSMAPGSMGDDEMGAMGSMPMNDEPPMGKMKGHGKMNSGSNNNMAAPDNGSPSSGNMNDR